MAWKRRASRRELLGIAAVSPHGIAAYVAYTWWLLGDPLAFLRSQGDWGGWMDRTGTFAKILLGNPAEVVFGEPLLVGVLLNVAMLVLWAATLPWIWKLLDPGIALFTSVLVVVYGTTTWISLGRYLIPAIGFYAAAGYLLTRPAW